MALSFIICKFLSSILTPGKFVDTTPKKKIKPLSVSLTETAKALII